MMGSSEFGAAVLGFGCRVVRRSIALLATAALLCVPAFCSGAEYSFSNMDGITIDPSGPASPYPSAMLVNGVAGQVTSVTVTLTDFTHNFPHDLLIMLVGPQGQTVLLDGQAMMFPGNGSRIFTGTLTFDSNAANPLPQYLPVTSGTYQPADFTGGSAVLPGAPAWMGSTDLGDFAGTDVNGIWSLYIYDAVSPDNGSVGSWTLSFHVPDPDEPGPTPDPDEEYITYEELPLRVAAPGVLANDYALSSGPLTAIVHHNPSKGTLVLHGDGGFLYTPLPGEVGTDHFDYVVFDGVNTSPETSATILILPLNDLPIANNDTFVYNEGTPLTVTAPGVLANDIDPDSAPLTAVLVAGPVYGSVSLNPNGSFVYTPSAGFPVAEHFYYKVSDGTGESNVASVELLPRHVNHPPTARPDIYSTPGETTLAVGAPGVLVNDNDPDGDALSAVVQANASHGVLVLNSNGSFTYTPNAGYGGPDSFTYVATDGEYTTGPVTVTINVGIMNHAPIARDDAYSMFEDDSLTVGPRGILANDYDPDGTLPSVSSVIQLPLHGELIFTINGAFIYTPDEGFSGTDIFTYQITDGVDLSNIATVAIVVKPVNTPPYAQDDDFDTYEGMPLHVSAPGVLANDTEGFYPPIYPPEGSASLASFQYDGDGDVLSAFVVSNPEHGLLTLNSDGSFDYVPQPGFVGRDSFMYMVSDGHSRSPFPAEVTIFVEETDLPPVGTNDIYAMTQTRVCSGSSGTLTVAAPGVLGNDIDPNDDDLSAILVNGPIHALSFTLNDDGSFEYFPQYGFTGDDTFTYRCSDGRYLTEPITVTIAVRPLAIPVIGIPDQFTGRQNTVLTVGAPGVLSNDYIEPTAGQVSAVLLHGPAHGSVVLNSDGSLVYTPDANFSGDDMFEYFPTDGFSIYEVIQWLAEAGAEYDGELAYTIPVTLHVLPVNQAPVAVNDIYVVSQGGLLDVDTTHGVLSNDTDSDGNVLSCALITAPLHGDVTLNADGSFSYEPAASFTGTDSFVYRANDGALNSEPATVTIQVEAVNHRPIAIDDRFQTNEGKTLHVSAPGILMNDYYPITGAPVSQNQFAQYDADGDPLAASVVSNPSNGNLFLRSDGSFDYTPNQNFRGTDSFTYLVSDGTLQSLLPATVTITVRPVNQPPIAVADVYATTEVKPLGLGEAFTTLTVVAPGVLANDLDPDDAQLTAVLVNGPVRAQSFNLNPDGSFTYLPQSGFVGTDTFMYRASDGVSYSDPVTVTIVVRSLIIPIIGAPDQFSTNENVPLSVGAPGVLGNDYIEPTVAQPSAVMVNGPLHGSVVLNSDGSFVYTPDANYKGPDLFTYFPTDGFALYELLQLIEDRGFEGNVLEQFIVPVVIQVRPVNQQPIAVNDLYVTDQEAVLDVDSTHGVLSNDVDVDGDALSAVLITAPLHGELTLNADGSFIYNPAIGFSGSDSFVYRASDGLLQSDPATVTINVAHVNHVPVASRDHFACMEGAALSVAAPGVLYNDVDLDGDALKAVILTGPENGTVVLASDGSFIYTPNPYFHGTDGFLYAANDGTSSSFAAAVTITVGSVNDAPVAVNDSYVVSQGAVLDVDTTHGVLSNDTDVDGDVLATVLITSPLHGEISLNADGSFSYTPDPAFTGTDSFVYRASDGTLVSEPATVTIRVEPVNHRPVAVNDAFQTNENKPLHVSAPGVLGNDFYPISGAPTGQNQFAQYDVDGDQLAASVVSNPHFGNLDLRSDGSFDYTPNQNFRGVDSFTYVVSDGTLQSLVPATVVITVRPVDQAPSAVNDIYVVSQGDVLDVPQARGVLSNDTDPEFNFLACRLITSPLHGNLTLRWNGSFTYEPDPAFTGTDSFVYRASDGFLFSEPATVTIQVEPVNHRPVAIDDTFQTMENQTLHVSAPGVLVNDYYPIEGAPGSQNQFAQYDVDGDQLAASVVGNPSNGNLVLRSDGSFDYTPNQNFNGTDTFTYLVSDGILQSLVPATVTITVRPVNEQPLAVADLYVVNQEAVLDVDSTHGVLSNDVDVDGDALSAVLITAPLHGELTLNADGSFIYNPAIGFSGTDSFVYRASDGQSQSEPTTVVINVTHVNHVPVATDDQFVGSEGATLSVATPGVLNNDVDLDGDSLQAVIVTGAANGAVTLASNGSFIYTPNDYFNGQDSFTYVANDGTTSSLPATVTITVRPVNNAPVAVNDSYVVSQGAVLDVDTTHGVLSNDTDVDGDALASVLITSPLHGEISLNADGSFSYTPDPAFRGTDSFVYRANDGALVSEPATVTIRVEAVNHRPIAVDDGFQTMENQPLHVSAPGVLINDYYPIPAGPTGQNQFAQYDVDGDQLAASVVSNPHFGNLDLRSDGSFDYAPNSNFCGVDSFTYLVSDGTLQSLLPATVIITVRPVNQAPNAVNDIYVVSQGDVLDVLQARGVLSNDTDPDGDVLTCTLITSPLHGDLTLRRNGAFTYEPDPAFVGTDSFVYRANDGKLASEPATVTIQVEPVNHRPVAIDDTFQTNENQTLHVSAPGVLINDYYPISGGEAGQNQFAQYDVDGDQLAASVISNPSNGNLVLRSDGSFDYTPNQNFRGTDSFTYLTSDGILQSLLPATVTITVRPVNQPPVAVADIYATTETKLVSLLGNGITTLDVAAPGVLANDLDPDDAQLTAVLVNAPVHAQSFVLNADGSFAYIPQFGFVGNDSFQYRASDGVSLSETVTVTILVRPLVIPAIGMPDRFSTNENVPLSVGAPGVLGNDYIEPSAKHVSAILVNGPTHGSVALNSDGSFVYTPDANFHGDDMFTYFPTDGFSMYEILELLAGDGITLGQDFMFEAPVMIHVFPVNQAPTAVNDVYVVSQGAVLDVDSTHGVLSNDTDPDDDVLSSVLITAPLHGTLTLNEDGSFSYQPEASFRGTDTFIYRATDGSLDSEPATVSIQVEPVNHRPIAVDDGFVTNENQVLRVSAPGVLINDYYPITGAPESQNQFAQFDADGDPLAASVVSNPSHGDLHLRSDGSFDYTPNQNFRGTDSFTYLVSDGTLQSPAPATVTITVRPVNQPPVAVADIYAAKETKAGGISNELSVSSPGVLANDLDPDDAQLTAVLVNGPVHAQLFELNSDGSFDYVPEYGFVGTDTFMYRASDGVSYSEAVTVTIVVRPVILPVMGVKDEFSTNENVPLSVAAPGVMANDYIEPSAQNPSAVVINGPHHGSVVLNSDGSFVYTPDPNFSGRDMFSYFPSDGFTLYELLQLLEGDGFGGEGDGEGNVYLDDFIIPVMIKVLPVNQQPVAINDLYVVTEDGELDVDSTHSVLSNDVDVDGDVLTAVLITYPLHGSLTLNDDGSFTYQPETGFSGSDSFVYRASDGLLESNPAAVLINVTHVNHVPVAVNDAFVGTEGSALVIPAPGVLNNDADADGDALRVVLMTGTTSGTIDLASDGSFVYTPNQYFHGVDTFTYLVNDGKVPSLPATVTITVRPINNAPVAVDDEYFGLENELLVTTTPGVLGNDVDVDGDPIVAEVVTGPLHGTVIVSPDGSFEYLPNPNYSGNDRFTYQAFDGEAKSEVATVVLHITPVNQAPVANADMFSTQEGAILSVPAPGVIANDFDVDGNALSAVLLKNPEHGSLILNSNGSFVYSPEAGFNGADAFTYKANDGTSDSLPVEVVINVGPVNNAPVAVNDEFQVQEDATLNIAPRGVLSNDTDIDDAVLSAVLVTPPLNGNLALLADGSLVYTPRALFNGVDSFKYQASDGKALSNVATVVIRVLHVNHAPEANEDAYSLTENAPLTVAVPGVLANDVDVDGDALHAVVQSAPLNGEVRLSADGSFVYTPNTDFSGTDEFTYLANDGTLNSGVTTVTLTIRGVNQPPVAVNDIYTGLEDHSLHVDVTNGLLVNDTDPEFDPLSAIVVHQAQHGTVELNADGSFAYYPDEHYRGPDFFTYQAFDGVSLSNVAIVNITLDPFNHAPIGTPDEFATSENVPLPVAAPGVLINDIDVDGDQLFAVLSAGPAHGTVTLNSDGSFLYTPDTDFVGDDQFIYWATDGDVSDAGDFQPDSDIGFSDGVLVTIHVMQKTATPIAVNDTYFTTQNQQLDVDEPGVLGNDIEPNGVALSAVLITAPLHGVLSLNSDGSFSYRPALHFHGTDSFVYRASNGSKLSLPATATITVAPANEAPIGVEDAFSTYEDLPLSVSAPGVLNNDVDYDNNKLSATLVHGPAHGLVVLNSDGSFVYTPDQYFSGSDSFVYRAYDGQLASGDTVVSITVRVRNHAPVALDDAYATKQNQVLTVNAYGVLSNDFDADFDALQSTLVTAPLHGTVLVLTDGSFVYTPLLNFSGADWFTYRATDGKANSNIATVRITVDPVNQAPTLENLIVNGPINEGDLGVVTANIVDAESADYHQVFVNWGDGSVPDVIEVPANRSFVAATHRYLDNRPSDAPYPIHIQVADSKGATTAYDREIIVHNVVPTIDTTQVIEQVATQRPTSITCTFHDPGVLDSFIVTVSWGDGATDSLNLPAGSHEFTVTHAYTDPGNYPFEIRITDKDGGFDRTGGYDEVRGVVQVATGADLVITETITPSDSIITDAVTYTATVTNNGPDTATGVVVTMVIAGNIQIVGTIPSSSTITSNTVTFNLGTLAPFESRILVVSGVASTPGSGSSTATVFGNEFDPNPTNNTVSVATSVGPTPNGVDLKGNWLDAKAIETSSGKTKTKTAYAAVGKLQVTNRGRIKANRAMVYVYMSDTPNVTAKSKLIMSKGYKLLGLQTVLIPINYTVPRGVDCHGKYLVCVLDPSNMVVEWDETNNTCVARMP